MYQFSKEFSTLSYVFTKAKRVLLIAHSAPDGDTVGSVLALKEYLCAQDKAVDITCFDEFPMHLSSLASEKFLHPDTIDTASYDAVVASDSVERGYKTILPKIPDNIVTVVIDHHPDISVGADILIINPRKSSACELVYEFLEHEKATINKKIATCLMAGILSDTGMFQHANTSSRVMEIAANLLRSGASMPKIIEATLANKKISTLKLWGKAFEKAKINKASGMIATALTRSDVEECAATTDDIAQVASILNTVPGTKFALILSERENGKIKGSLRSEAYKGIDVSEIAHQFGGGGHKLASGFEIAGRILETDEGWEIV